MSQEIHDRIVKYRKMCGLNQAQAAQQLGINRSTYAYRELHGQFTPDMLVRLAQIFDVSLNDILMGKNEQRTQLFEPIEPESVARLGEDMDKTPLGQLKSNTYDSTINNAVKILRILSKDKREKALAYINELYHEQNG